ncbi:hypothetical protein AURDEDRAFT_187364 [Auricularia subglabra TFB-10046 SS5]|nr:hypothetical protein AURDEDRAFT_187364 [Auricularia subglabra TFB-10046 SS5]
MELTLANRCPLNTTAASKLDARQYTVRTPFALPGRTTTICGAAGGELAQVEWAAFGADFVVVHGQRRRLSALLRRAKWWLHSRSFELDGVEYTWLDVPFRPLRLVREDEKVPIAVLTQRALGKTQLSISTEGMVALGPDPIFIGAVIMLQLRRQRRHQRTSTARAVRV